MWTLIIGEFKYHKRLIRGILTAMVLVIIFYHYYNQLEIVRIFDTLPAILGISGLMGRLAIMKKEKRDVLLASLPVGVSKFALFRALFPITLAAIATVLYIATKKLFMPTDEKMYSIMLFAAIWLLFHSGSAIIDDLKHILPKDKDFNVLIGITVAVIIMIGLTVGFLFLMDSVMTTTSGSDFMDYFVFVFWTVMLSLASIFTYKKRTRFV